MTTIVLLAVAACRSDDGAGTSTVAGDEAASQVRDAGDLADTTWRLVEFQSMDDAIGTTTPHDRAAYTMRLNADGTVTMRLNCNRATGTWKAETGRRGTSGTFTFGPLAVTRALCPPPSMDEEIARQSAYIRSFMLKDGDLYLSLMADGGIYQWEPNPASGDGEPTAGDPAGSADATGPDDSATRAGQGDFDARGDVPCAVAAGQPMGRCQFGVARAGGGTATVVITRPDGSTRAIFFRLGRPTGADTSQADGMPPFGATKNADLHMITVGEERYEIPDAVVLGG